MKYLIAILFIFGSCHNRTCPSDSFSLYEEHALLEDGRVRIAKYWIDEEGKVIFEIDTLKNNVPKF